MKLTLLPNNHSITRIREIEVRKFYIRILATLMKVGNCKLWDYRASPFSFIKYLITPNYGRLYRISYNHFNDVEMWVAFDYENKKVCLTVGDEDLRKVRMNHEYNIPEVVVQYGIHRLEVPFKLVYNGEYINYMYKAENPRDVKLSILKNINLSIG